MMRYTWHTISATLASGEIISFERYNTTEALLDEYTEPFNNLYGVGNWSIAQSN